MAEPRFGLFLLLLAIGALISANAEQVCSPSSKAPEGRALWSQPLVTMTGRVLAHVVGYVRLYGDRFNLDSYLPLKLNQADDLFQWTREGFNNHKLTLAGECAVLVLNYTRAGESIIYNDLTMHIRDQRLQQASGSRRRTGGGGSTGDWRQLCTFSPKFAFVHAKSKHFSCLEKRSHLCVANGEPVAELVLERIKLETNVVENLFAEQTFDKPPLEVSCSYW